MTRKSNILTGYMHRMRGQTVHNFADVSLIFPNNKTVLLPKKYSTFPIRNYTICEFYDRQFVITLNMTRKTNILTGYMCGQT